MEVLEGEKDVSCVKCRIIEFKSLTMVKIKVKLTSNTIVEIKVQPLTIFKRVLELHYERILSTLKDASLRQGVIDLAELAYILFLENFHSVVPFSLLVHN